MNTNHIKNNDHILKINCILIIILLLPVAYILHHFCSQIITRMAEEITLAYTADAPIYWTVGNGMLKGLKPYADFYETKPPGIFILSAVSFALTGNSIVTNIICFFCLITIGLIPVIGVFLYNRKKHSFSIPTIILYAGAILFGAMLMLYAQLRSGSAQVESIGAAFGAVYILLISTINGEKTSLKSPKIWLAAFFLMCSVMMKEPFVLVCCASALLFIHTKKDALKKLVVPLLTGGAVGAFIMLITGTLVPYLKYYFPNMLGGHVSRYGSPWKRGLDFKKLLNDLGEFSSGLQISIIILAAYLFLSILYKQLKRHDTDIPSVVSRIYHAAKLFVIAYLAVFSVALGGQYYNHHYIFAVPVYIAVFLYCAKDFRNIKIHEQKANLAIAGVLLSVTVTCSAGAIFLPEYKYNTEEVVQNLETMQHNADYVDTVLEATEVERYQFLGFNGNVFYCFTDHLPQGPIFIQDKYNFTDENNWFSQSLIEQLEKSDIVILEKVDVGILDDYVNSYLEINFTEVPWEEAAGIKKPASFTCTLLFRKK